MYKNNTNVDGAVSVFGDNFSKSIGVEDAVKFPNGGENIAFVINNKDVSINGYALPTVSDEFPVHLYNLKSNTSYTLRLDASEFTGNGVDAYIKDNVTGAKTLLAGSNTALTFATVTTDAANYGNRYSIVFGASALPVKSIAVTAAAQSNGILVKWSVTGETNVASYVIEHSTNGVSFSTLSTAKAGNATYSYVDAAAQQGNNYYRIKVVNNTGSVGYSSVVVAVAGKAKGAISVYPNPVVGNNFNLQLNNLEAGSYAVRIVNKLGQQVFAKNISHVSGSSSEAIATSKLASGTYTISLTGSNGTAYQTQIEVK